MLAHTQVHHVYTHTDNIYTNILYSKYISTHVPYTYTRKEGREGGGREGEGGGEKIV